MSGIYVHIPFCRKACSYCDFHFSTSLQLQDPLIDAMITEIALRKAESKEPVKTLYFGGGTPSLLDPADLTKVVAALRSAFPMDGLEEVTLEANPEDVTTARIKAWKALGVTRLSIGTQSFFAQDLQFMNRDHSPEQAEASVKRAQDEGLDNLSIDLIYGIPGQSFEQWQENVGRATDLNTPHLSSYCLTIELRTALHHALEKGAFVEKPEEEIEREYLHLHQTLESQGLEHYEISNFGKRGWHAMHNNSYWGGVPYLGFGPSAHSFDGERTRSWNKPNNARYIQAMKAGTLTPERERLSTEERCNEMLMTGLRTRIGVSLVALRAASSATWWEAFERNLNGLPPHMRSWVLKTGDQLALRPEHWLTCDALVREIIV